VGVFNNIFIHADFDIFSCPGNADLCQPPPQLCQTASPGFWKNHPDAWPIQSVVIGGVTYTKAQAIALMSLPKGGDSRLIVFFQLVSAKLNVAGGSPSSCITSTITALDAFMQAHPLPPTGPIGPGVKDSGANTLADILSNYNNDQTAPCGGAPTCPSAQ
jgi:hypothetical protein